MTRLRLLMAHRRLRAGTGLAGLALLGVLPQVSATQALSWSVVPSPSPGPSSSLSAVSCRSATACTAVGSYQPTVHEQDKTLIESWNGTRWSVVPSPSPGSLGNYLTGVSCASAMACTAVGYYQPTIHEQDKTLIESWNGTRWSVAPSPSRGAFDYLRGVSCVSATACTAVGNSDASISARAKTLIESWNGSRWSVVPSPSPSSGQFSGSYLDGVSCVSAAACTAAGENQASSTGPYQTLIESWNGSRWSVVPSPSPGSLSNYLDGVSCVSRSTCTVAGYASSNSGQDTLIESWNGKRWSEVPSPSSRTASSYLDGVSCVSATACTAAGLNQPFTRNGRTRSLIESWNGKRWSVVRSPSSSTSWNNLFGVSCVSATACTAAGGSKNRNKSPKTLIESGTAS